MVGRKPVPMQWLDAITTGGVPVEWDRVTDDGEAIKVYGWIPRHDGTRDFLLVKFDDETIEFTTSSAKYSAEIGRLLCFEKGEHVKCIPFTAFFDGVHVTEKQRKAIRAMQEPKQTCLDDGTKDAMNAPAEPRCEKLHGDGLLGCNDCRPEVMFKRTCNSTCKGYQPASTSNGKADESGSKGRLAGATAGVEGRVRVPPPATASASDPSLENVQAAGQPASIATGTGSPGHEPLAVTRVSTGQDQGAASRDSPVAEKARLRPTRSPRRKGR